MPMFPLGTVLFPHALLPLHVFEPRYRLMTQRVLRRRRRVRCRAHRAGERGGRRRHALRRRHGRPDRARAGAPRRRLRARDGRDPPGSGRRGGCPTIPTRRRRSSIVAEDPGADGRRPALRARAVAALGEVCALYRRIDPRFPELPAIADGAEQASYEIAALAPIGPLDAQRVLETVAAGDRLALLAELLDEHARVLRAGDFLE